VSIPFNVPGWAIGDSLALARQLPDESIDCIVTSPPYWGLRSYLADDDPSKALEMGAEPTLAEYVERLVVLFRELRRALKAGGTCWLNLGDSYSAGGAGMRTSHPQQSRNGQGVCGPRDLHPSASRANSAGFKDYGDPKPKDLCLVPYRVALALQADGWWLRDNIVWHKPNPMPASVTDRCTSAHEAVFLLTKSARYWFDAEAVKEPMVSDGCGGLYVADSAYRKASQTGGKAAEGRRTESEGRNKRNVWTIATRPYSGSHYAVMPPALVEPCIQAGCPAGGLVLDPFGGSGTVGQVAESLGRKWLMFDLDARNEALMAQRTAQRSLLGMIR
jgi:DNA modification methylase